MMALRTLLAALVAATGLVVLAPAPAFACSCATGDPRQFVKWADVVVVGEITAITPPPDREVVGSADPVAHTVVVDEVLKGDVGETVEITSARYGASCGLEGIEVGREYVVFAAHRDFRGDTTDELWANLCGGTAPASGAYVAETVGVTGPGHPPTADDPAADDPADPDAVGPADADGPAAAAESTSDAAGIPGWAWPAAGAAVLLGLGGLLAARRRRRALP